MDLENRIIELETRLSYQDHVIQELNEVVIRQQNQIDSLIRDRRRIMDHLKEQGQAEALSPEEEAPPPHY
ncbi:MAG TPA: SlyX family protein [Mariprofundaceae bacterium]|nr:SlyX family protein [Mariprofundaceae bacterium]